MANFATGSSAAPCGSGRGRGRGSGGGGGGSDCGGLRLGAEVGFLHPSSTLV